MHAVLSSVILTLAIMGCAGVSSSSGSGGGPNQISREQLRQAELEGLSAWEIINRVRPPMAPEQRKFLQQRRELRPGHCGRSAVRRA